MKTNYIIGALLTISALVISIPYYLQRNHQHKNSYRIAIFEPAAHPAIDEIAQGIQETMEKRGKAPYVFKRFNANGNKTLMRAQAEEIIHDEYDLIVPIGADCSRIMQELTTKKQQPTPIVFTAVGDPVGLGIVKSLARSGNHVTGVTVEVDYTPNINQLLAIKPDTKKVLLVYDPTIKSGVGEEYERAIRTILQQKGISLQSAQIYESNEIQSKVQPLLEDIDVVLVLEDNTIVAGIDSLITLCNRYNITLYASDLNSGDKGAALSFGVVQYDYGSTAAELALRILEQQKLPTNIPVTFVKGKRLQINTSTMAKQGLALSPTLLEKVKQEGGIII